MLQIRIAGKGAAGLMILVTLAGCGADAGEGRLQADTPDGVCDSTAASGCYAPPPGFPLAFTTRVPESIVASMHGIAPAEQIRFAVRDEPDAFLYLVVHPDSAGVQEVDEVARAVADSYGIIRQFDEPQLRQIGWAETAYDISGAKGDEVLEGYVGYAQRGDRWYQMILQYPEARRQELRPLLEGIIGSWEWSG